MIIKDNSRIADNSVVAAGTIIPSLGLWGGSPGKSTFELWSYLQITNDLSQLK